jgi:hypothetical protein
MRAESSSGLYSGSVSVSPGLSTNMESRQLGSNSQYSILTEDMKEENRVLNVAFYNKRVKPCCFIFHRRVNLFKNNAISTSKYNILTFLPLNLMLQFSKMANAYFLVMLILEMVPQLLYP